VGRSISNWLDVLVYLSILRFVRVAQSEYENEQIADNVEPLLALEKPEVASYGLYHVPIKTLASLEAIYLNSKLDPNSPTYEKIR